MIYLVTHGAKSCPIYCCSSEALTQQLRGNNTWAWPETTTVPSCREATVEHRANTSFFEEVILARSTSILAVTHSPSLTGCSNLDSGAQATGVGIRIYWRVGRRHLWEQTREVNFRTIVSTREYDVLAAEHDYAHPDRGYHRPTDSLRSYEDSFLWSTWVTRWKTVQKCLPRQRGPWPYRIHWWGSLAYAKCTQHNLAIGANKYR